MRKAHSIEMDQKNEQIDTCTKRAHIDSSPQFPPQYNSRRRDKVLALGISVVLGMVSVIEVFLPSVKLQHRDEHDSRCNHAKEVTQQSRRRPDVIGGESQGVFHLITVPISQDGGPKADYGACSRLVRCCAMDFTRIFQARGSTLACGLLENYASRHSVLVIE